MRNEIDQVVNYLNATFNSKKSSQESFFEEIDVIITNYRTFRTSELPRLKQRINEIKINIELSNDHLMTNYKQGLELWIEKNKSQSVFLTKLHEYIKWCTTTDDSLGDLERELISLDSKSNDNNLELKKEPPKQILYITLNFLNIRERAKIVTLSKEWRNIIENIKVSMVPLINLRLETGDAGYLILNLNQPKMPLYQLRKEFEMKKITIKELGYSLRKYFLIFKQIQADSSCYNKFLRLFSLVCLGSQIIFKCKPNENYIPILTCDFSNYDSRIEEIGNIIAGLFGALCMFFPNLGNPFFDIFLPKPNPEKQRCNRLIESFQSFSLSFSAPKIKALTEQTIIRPKKHFPCLVL